MKVSNKTNNKVNNKTNNKINDKINNKTNNKVNNKINGKIKFMTKKQEMEGMEQTYIMIKPDGVQRGIVGRIITRWQKQQQQQQQQLRYKIQH